MNNVDTESMYSTMPLEGQRCNTCKAIFSSIDKLKSHYKGDWHIFNSKRRSNGLIPLTKDEFKRVQPMLAKKKVAEPIISQNKNSERKEIICEISVKDNDVDNVDEKDTVVMDAEVPPELLLSTVSIFDNKTFDTTEECVEYMGVTFGFFIPDIEYLVELDSMINYLNEKVKIGNVCLYCQRMFRTYRSCQNHMISKSHCKIYYEEGIDAEEFEDFYDFSTTYDDENLEYDENGNIIEKSLQISSIGELILPDGRVVGHRAFRKYYKQRFRAPENRDSVLAVQREELMRLIASHYGVGNRLTHDEVISLSDVQVMAMLMTQQKEIRKNQVIEQRLKQSKDFIDQRREYKSNVDKLRSSATTTAKIRDYHSRLM